MVDFLKKELGAYLQGNRSKGQLGKWAREEYYNILKGGFINLDNLAIYEFVKQISNIDIEADDIRDEYPLEEIELQNIYHILIGKSEKIFNGKIRLHESIFNNLHIEDKLLFYRMIKDIIFKVANKVKITTEERRILKEFVESQNENTNSLLSMLEIQIKEAITNISSEFSDEIMIRKSFCLYVGKRELHLDKEMEDLLKLIDCLVGEKYFNINILYRDGACRFTIMI